MDGIGSAGAAYGPRGPERALDTERPAPSRDAGGTDRGAPVRREPPATATPTTPPAAEAVPEEGISMPDGVEPELWSLLTTEERAHFARFAAMGGVTYGPKTASSNRPFVRGQRLDVRI